MAVTGGKILFEIESEIMAEKEKHLIERSVAAAAGRVACV